jgi:hypothetical protein
MSREKLPQLIVDIADRLKDEFVAPQVSGDDAIWNAMERLKTSELRLASRVGEE